MADLSPALEKAAAQFAKTWEHEYSSAQGAAHDAFIAGAGFRELSDAPNVKPLDLSNVIRDAFLAGRGLVPTGAVTKIPQADLDAWVNYDPDVSKGHHARVLSALYPLANGTRLERAESKTGLRMGDYLLRAFFEGGKNIRRASWPEGDHISADGAEGGAIWYYDAEDDDLSNHYRLGFHDLGAGDWEIMD